MTTATPSFVVVYHARDIAEAYIVRTALEEAGIAVQVENEQLQTGGEMLGWMTTPLVLVEESDVPAANELIAQINAHASAEQSDGVTADATCCLACGAELAESQTKCAACGWTYDEPA